MHENVGQLEIPVHDFVLDQGLERVEDLDEELDCLLLVESFLFFQVGWEVTLIAILKDQIKVVRCLLDIIQFDDVAVVTGFEYLDLVLEQLHELALIRLQIYPLYFIVWWPWWRCPDRFVCCSPCTRRRTGRNRSFARTRNYRLLLAWNYGVGLVWV